MKSALPTAPAAYGLNGPSATATVDNATPAGLHLSTGKFCPNKRGQLFACFERKPIYALNNDDRLATVGSDTANTSSIPRLFGYASLHNPKQRQALSLVDKSIVTVSELQEAWINYYTSTILPEFPYSYSTGEAKIRLADAHFCFLGHWFYCQSGAGSGGKSLQGSPYAVVPLRSIGVKAAGRLSGGNASWGYPTVFSEYGFPTLKLKPHSLRHFGNTLADLSEIPKEVITAWSGRVDKGQTNTYLHVSHEERADRLRAVIGKPEHDKREVRVVTQEAIMQGINLPATITSTGICTQELNLTPCDYLNDFVSQCFMCSASCHIAGDTKAIQFFERDLEVQVARLALVSKDRRLPKSSAMQKWFVIHSRNTHVLAKLIDILKKFEAGSIIRFSSPTDEFHVTDPITKEIKKAQCAIPDFDGKLHGLIAEQTVDR